MKRSSVLLWGSLLFLTIPVSGIASENLCPVLLGLLNQSHVTAHIENSLPSSHRPVTADRPQVPTKNPSEHRKESTFQYYARKIWSLPKRDFSTIYEAMLRPLIYLTARNPKAEYIPLSQLKAIHPIGWEKEKLQGRANGLKKERSEVEKAGRLSTKVLDRAAPSHNSIKVIRDRDGNLIVFNGNNRLAAVRAAFPDMPDLPVEVRVYPTRSSVVAALAKKVRFARGLILEELPDELRPVQNALFAETFHSVMEDLRLGDPELARKMERAWGAGQQAPDYKDWPDYFLAMARGESADAAAMDHLRTIILGKRGRQMRLNGLKLPRKIKKDGTFDPNKIQVEDLSFTLQRDPKGFFDFDIDKYVGDRIPAALRRFVIAKDIPIYLHNSGVEEALLYHRQSAGFNQAIPIQSRRGANKKEMFLLLNTKTGAKRLVIAGIPGHEALGSVVKQLAYDGKIKRIHIAQHEKAAEIFIPTEAAQKLSFEPTDTLLMGFNGHVKDRYEKLGWKTEELSVKGLRVTLLTNPTTGQRMVSTGTAYGDGVKPILDFFYSRNMRRFMLVGTTGSLVPDHPIGSVTLPTSIVRKDKVISFNNAFDRSPQSVGLKRTSHSSVSSIVDENEDRIRTLSQAGADTIDVEGQHFVTFFHDKSDAKLGVAFIVSDQFGTENTYEKHDGTKEKVFEALPSVFSLIDESLK